ncbi:hypothetical protein MMC24_001795 [Lignoscripta atroalba]|nr:hypothetical protein [Lignoscripta atroalba]
MAMANQAKKPTAAASAARNVLNVVLGDILFKTWYPSFYPEELVGREIERLYVCQWCFKYTKEGPPFGAHVLFTQNLSLFAKLFLDNKSVFFDVASFNYYLLVQQHPPPRPHQQHHRQIIGFFSKEKMSWDNNNLACILVFPPWQRRGLGKILMGVSYELSKREGRIGGPEKPLSELGRRGYLRFWEARVARAILGMKAKSSMTVAEVAQGCWMLVDDVVVVLKEMEVLAVRTKGDGSVVVSKARVREWAEANDVDLTPPVDEECFVVDEWLPQMEVEAG